MAFILQIEFAITVSEIDLAAGLESAAVLNTFALSCPIPLHISGALNSTKAVEVSLAAYRSVKFLIFYVDLLLLNPQLVPARGRCCVDCFCSAPAGSLSPFYCFF
jgi:hypothetical protein